MRLVDHIVDIVQNAGPTGITRNQIQHSIYSTDIEFDDPPLFNRWWNGPASEDVEEAINDCVYFNIAHETQPDQRIVPVTPTKTPTSISHTTSSTQPQ